MAYRKLVSTSQAAGTGMHRAMPAGVFSSDRITVSFWWKANSSNSLNTIFASTAGEYRIYSGSTSQRALVGSLDGTTNTGEVDATVTSEWVFVVYHAGLNHSTTTDVKLSIRYNSQWYDGFATGSSASADDITDAHTLYLLGDAANGAATDDGFEGEFADICIFDGIISEGDLQSDLSGNWQDLPQASKDQLVVRLLGTDDTNAGVDASGNGYDFTVENGGVTTSETDLPPGFVAPSVSGGSANFDGAIDDGWSQAGPAFSGLSVVDGRLRWSFAAGDSYDAGTSGSTPGTGAPRIETDVSDEDLLVDMLMSTDALAFDAVDFVGCGFFVQAASGDTLRLDLYTKGDFVAAYGQAGSTGVASANSPPGNPLGERRGWPSSQRLERTASTDEWVWSMAWDGYTFQPIASFTWAETPTKLGVYAFKIGTQAPVDFEIDYVHIGGRDAPTAPSSVSRTTQLDEDFADLSAWTDDSVSGGSASVSGNVLTLACTGTAGSSGRIQSVGNYPENVGVLLRYRDQAGSAANTYFGVVVRGSGAWAGPYTPDTALVFEGNPTNGLVRLLRAAGPSNYPDGADWTFFSEYTKASGDPSAGWVWARFEAVGPILRTRTWADGDAEPSTWDDEVLDDAVRGPGKVGIAYSHNTNNSGSGAVEFADLEVYEIAEAAAAVTGDAAVAELGADTLAASAAVEVAGVGDSAEAGDDVAAAILSADDSVNLSAAVVESGFETDVIEAVDYVNISGFFIEENYFGSGEDVADTGELAGDYIQWSYTPPVAGDYEIRLRYTSGFTVDKTLDLYIDGGFVASATLPPTGAWGVFNVSDVLTAQTFTTNPHIIELRNVGEDPYNTESIRLTTPVVTPYDTPQALGAVEITGDGVAVEPAADIAFALLSTGSGVTGVGAANEIVGGEPIVDQSGDPIVDENGDPVVTSGGTEAADGQGSVEVTASAAANEAGADVASAVGTAPFSEITATAALTEDGADAVASSAAVLVSAAAASTETGADAAAASGTVAFPGVTASAAASETGADVAASVGEALVSAAGAAPETGADAAAAVGTAAQPAGTGAAIEVGADAAAASAAVALLASAVASEVGADAVAASGVVAELAATGSGAVTEAGSDTAAALAGVAVSGVAAAAESGLDDASAVGAAAQPAGTGAVFEAGADVAVASAQVAAVGLSAVAEIGTDALAAAGSTLIAAVGSPAESGDDAAAGTGTADLAPGTGAAFEVGDDAAAALATVAIGGQATAVEQPDTTFTDINVLVQGSGATTEVGADVASGESSAAQPELVGNATEAGADQAFASGAIRVVAIASPAETQSDAVTVAADVVVTATAVLTETGNDLAFAEEFVKIARELALRGDSSDSLRLQGAMSKTLTISRRS